MPAKLFCGTVTSNVGVTVNVPWPLLAAASKNDTAAGAVLAAGTVTGTATELTGLTQVPLAQPLLTDVILVAVVGSVCVPAVRVVEVIVKCHPGLEPVLVSLAVSAAVNGWV